ncbi:vesicle-associated protein 1-4-like [Bidens hawaiensis]|uniref:vesicle-associated protein 1-4-like n=1 Tax=Bidens hawaiensis TaxID=980011 RepID=UPI00404958F5
MNEHGQGIFTIQAQKETPLDLQCKDKFLIQNAILKQEAIKKGITGEMFVKDSRNVVEECKLRVVYDHPCSSLSTSAIAQKVFPSNASRKLVSIDPLELKFPFVLEKQMASSVQLTNKTDKHVAFKLYTTEPKKYFVRPNIGVVLPQSKCEIIVYSQAQKTAPLDMQCHDKFLIRSVIATQEDIKKGITGEMFTKESGNVVEECKLKAVYVPSTPLTSTFAQGVQVVLSFNALEKYRRNFSGIEALRLRFMQFWVKIGQNNQKDEEILNLLDKKVV